MTLGNFDDSAHLDRRYLTTSPNDDQAASWRILSTGIFARNASLRLEDGVSRKDAKFR